MTTRRPIIYGLVDPRNGAIRYVGQSIHGSKRANRHWSDIARGVQDGNKHKANWIKSLITAGCKYSVVILEECCDRDSLNEAEGRWIAHGLSNGWPLTNICKGGGVKDPSPETRAKIGLASRSRKHPKWSPAQRAAFEARKEEWRAKLVGLDRKWSAARRARHEASEADRKLRGEKRHIPSEATRKLWSAQRKGRVMTPEQRAKQSKSMKEACATQEAIERLRRAGRNRYIRRQRPNDA